MGRDPPHGVRVTLKRESRVTHPLSMKTLAAFILLLLILAPADSAHGADWAATSGSPLTCDSSDERYRDCLDAVKRRIDKRLTPCAEPSPTDGCEPLNGRLIVEFGILESGQLRYVEVLQLSGRHGSLKGRR
jgi:hypothetical protein